MEAQGVEPVLFSTRMPPAGIVSHEWAPAAKDRTTYLSRLGPLAFVAGTRVASVALVTGLSGRAAQADRAWFRHNCAVLAPFAAVLARQARAQGRAPHTRSFMRSRSSNSPFGTALRWAHLQYHVAWGLRRLWLGSADKVAKCFLCDSRCGAFEASGRSRTCRSFATSARSGDGCRYRSLHAAFALCRSLEGRAGADLLLRTAEPG